MAGKKVKINRAPVLTLWATIVAERTGYSHEEALTLGKAVAGLNAQSKAKRLGLIGEPAEKGEKPAQEHHEPKAHMTESITILGRPVPITHTDHGIRAISKDKLLSPASVQRYLQQRFGDNLAAVETAMQALAEAYPPNQLAAKAYSLYEKFRPTVPEGERGWGATGELDLDLIRSLTE